MLFVILTLSFLIIRLAPGGPFDDEQGLPSAIKANLDAAYGLDQPIATQYLRYLAGLAHGSACAIDHANPIMNRGKLPLIVQRLCQFLGFGQSLKRLLHILDHPGDLDQLEQRRNTSALGGSRLWELRQRLQRLCVV